MRTVKDILKEMDELEEIAKGLAQEIEDMELTEDDTKELLAYSMRKVLEMQER